MWRVSDGGGKPTNGQTLIPDPFATDPIESIQFLMIEGRREEYLFQLSIITSD